MRALLFIAHGSRQTQANEEILELAREIEARGDQRVDCVQPAFLEQAQPDMHGGLERCVERGAKEIWILPYFLNTGTHVSKDLPDFFQEARRRYPDREITLLPHIGSMLREVPSVILGMLPAD